MSLLGDLGSLPRRKQAAHALDRAKKHERRLNVHRAGIARRNFLRAARGAMAENITQQNVNSGGLDSSAFRGVAESIKTQRQTGVADALQSGFIQQRIQFEQDSAAQSLKVAENFQTFGDTAMAIIGQAG